MIKVGFRRHKPVYTVVIYHTVDKVRERFWATYTDYNEAVEVNNRLEEMKKQGKSLPKNAKALKQQLASEKVFYREFLIDNHLYVRQIKEDVYIVSTGGREIMRIGHALDVGEELTEETAERYYDFYMYMSRDKKFRRIF